MQVDHTLTTGLSQFDPRLTALSVCTCSLNVMNCFRLLVYLNLCRYTMADHPVDSKIWYREDGARSDAFFATYITLGDLWSHGAFQAGAYTRPLLGST